MAEALGDSAANRRLNSRRRAHPAIQALADIERYLVMMDMTL